MTTSGMADTIPIVPKAEVNTSASPWLALVKPTTKGMMKEAAIGPEAMLPESKAMLA